MTSPTSCPAADRLENFLDGALSENEQQEIALHLSDCSICQSRFEDLASRPEFLADAAALERASPRERETSLSQLVTRITSQILATIETRTNDSTPTHPPKDVSLEFLQPSNNPLHLGILGAYEILEVIGRGGMGVVLKGLDSKLNRITAIKVLAPQWASNEDARRRFFREAQTAAAVNHDHVVTIHSVEDAAELPYLVMECVAGDSLQQQISKQGPLDALEVARIGREAALGLAAAHEAGLIHRDVKPANILLDEKTRRVKITDFGLARAIDDAGETRPGVLVGTPLFMSPEQASGESVDKQSDLFSLGAALYAAIAGQPPFEGENSLSVLRQICDQPPRRLREFNSQIPVWLEEIIADLMAKKPEERIPTAKEAAQRLQQGLENHRREINPAKPSLHNEEHVEAGRSRRRQWWALAAAVLVMIIGGLGVTEATGLTGVAGFVAETFEIRTPRGTLVMKISDPKVQVVLQGDGETVTLKGIGEHEVQLRVGKHRWRQVQDGREVMADSVTITRSGKTVVQVKGLGGHDADFAGAGGTPLASNEIRRFSGHTERVLSLDISPDGRRLLSSDFAGSVRLWNIANGKTLRQLHGHTGAVECVRFTPNGKLAFTGGQDLSIRIWDLAGGNQIQQFIGHDGLVRQIAFFEVDDNQQVKSFFSSSDDSAINFWKTDHPTPQYRLAYHVGDPLPSPVRSKKDAEKLDYHVSWIRSLAMSPDRRHLLSAGNDTLLALWDVGERKIVRRYLEHFTVIARAVFTPLGDRIISCGYDNTIRIWETETGQLQHTITDHGGPVVDLDVSTDGGRFVSASADASIRIWSMTTYEEIGRLIGHQGQVNVVRFLPGGNQIVSAGTDKTIRLWKRP